MKMRLRQRIGTARDEGCLFLFAVHRFMLRISLIRMIAVLAVQV